MKILLSIICFVSALAVAFSPTPQKDITLKVKEIEFEGEADLAQISDLLENKTELHSIGLLNWDAFSYRPEVQFRIAHSNNQIWLKYYIKEKHILAEVTDINGAVSQDSCVEFFFDPLADGNYYNFEFNCIGTTHLAYGPARQQREFVDTEEIQDRIKVNSSLGAESFTERTGDFSWEMTIKIPAEILLHDNGIQLKGRTTRANFYKCGDKTSEKHYLSWNPVQTERPDFHRPEFFGKVIFE